MRARGTAPGLLTVLWLVVVVTLGFSSYAGAVGKKILRLGYMESLSQLPLITSYERDRFSYESVTVQMENYYSQVALEAAFRVGAVDVAYLPLSSAYIIAEENGDVGWGESLHQGKGGLLVWESIWQNRGHESLGVIGVLGLNSPGHLGMFEFMVQQHLEYGLDGKVRVVRREDMQSLLQQKQVAGLAIPEPYLTRVLLYINGNMVQKSYREVPFVLLYRPEMLTDTWTVPLAEWLRGVRRACLFLEQDVGYYGGEQTIITQSRYMGFDQQLLRLVFLKNPSSLSFVSRFVSPDEIQSTGNALRKLQLLKKNFELKGAVDPVAKADAKQREE